VIKKIQALIFIMASVVICIGSGCSSGDGDTLPYVAAVEDQEMTGVWLGGIQSTSGLDSTYRNGFSSSSITRDGQAVFMNEDGTQFIVDGTDDSYFSPEEGWIIGFGQIFEGKILVNIWDTNGADYSCKTGYPGSLDSDELSGEDNYFYGSVATQTLLWGMFRDEDYFGANAPYAGAFAYVYNTTYAISPKVTDLEGTWVANNVFKNGWTLELTITPDPLPADPLIDDTTSGTISGEDSEGNLFDGTITIHYTEEEEIEGNIYDVTLTFDGITMTGFVSYVQEVNTEGILIDDTALILGVSNQEEGYMINVLSTMAD